MKNRNLLYSVIIPLSIVIVSACSNGNANSNLSPSNAAHSSESNGSLEATPSASVAPSPTNSKVDPSIYFRNETTGKVEEDDKMFAWSSDDIKVSADKQKTGEGPDSLSLHNILVSKGSDSFSIKPALEVSKVESVSLSSNWSPKEATLAVAYGDTSSSKIAIIQDKKVQILSSDNYISTAYVLWSVDGNTVDCVSEKPSDQFKLYRMNAAEETAQEVMDVPREDLSKLTEYAPASFY